ncbi:MAG: endopeptidase [Actinomycetota bacterium]|nr:endopeptidase [Actinomycetota bacterium]
MSIARAITIAFVLACFSAGVVAFVSRTPASVRAAQIDHGDGTAAFTDVQIARHGAFHGPLYLAFGLGLVTQVVFLLLLRGPAIGQLAAWAQRAPGGWAVHAAIVAGVLAVAVAVIAFPLGYIRGFVIQHAWHLSTQAVPAWMLDQVKGLGLSCAFAAIAAIAFFGVVRWQPKWWWLWGAGSFTVLTAVLVFLFPIVIAPLFNRFTPLQDRVLSDRIEGLAADAGVHIDRIVVADASRRSTAENAYVAGIGASKQVVLYDTLIEGNEVDETLFVVAHEFGHEAHGDVLKGVGISAVGLFAGFAVLGWLVSSGRLLAWAGVDGPADLRLLPVLLLFALVAGLVTQPVQNAISRSFEAHADHFAFELTGDPAPAIRAFRRLAISNIADLDPPAVAVWMFYSHPPIADRIEAARAAESAKP